MPQASANNITIEYESFGDPANATILLVMGLGMQLIAWPEQFCIELASRGYRVVRYDNRDTGFSTKFGDAKTPSVVSLMIRVGLLDALGVKAAHIVGASMGGMIAQNVAASYPQRVGSLTSVMSTSGHRSLPGADPLVTRHLFRARPTGNDREAVIAHNMRTIELIGSPAFPIDEETRRQMTSISFDRCFFPSGFARHVAAIIKDGDRRDRLRTIEAPTLVIHGREDPLVPLAGGMDTAKHIAGARLEIIDGMGHNFPIELWPRIIDLIDEHAKRSDRES
jgi:pimeloyl-ACP methyl ester carboxylesterase